MERVSVWGAGGECVCDCVCDCVHHVENIV